MTGNKKTSEVKISKAFLKRFLLSWFPTATLISLLLFLSIQNLSPKNELEKAIQITRCWPQFPSSHLKLARALIINGHEELAKKELVIGQQQLQGLKILFIDYFFQTELKKTQNLINQKADLEINLKTVGLQLESYPYSWQLLLKKGLLKYQIYQDKEAQKILNLTFWLYPNNHEIQKAKNLVEGKNNN